ncbi:MAG: Fic family protein [Candidatus Peregrinibacteria bacterium]|nr:Fic family protein [Candidatus Peregrinibacteria bacterium]
MFEPKYVISERLLDNIRKITVITTELNFRKFSKVVLVEMERHAREVSAYSSTSIEGNPLPLTDVKRILKNTPQSIRDSEREVLNYNKILVYLNELLSSGQLKMSIALILKIQKNITDKLLIPLQSGHFRKEPVVVHNPKIGKVVYLPPDYKDVESLMHELIDFITHSAGKIDPLILAGIFHKQFVVIHPFVDGNGRTARLATKVLLASMGLNTFNLFSFENYYNQNVSRYFEEVGLIGNYYDLEGKIDFTHWLEYFTDGIIDELLRVKKILETASMNPGVDLRTHHQKIISYLEKYGYIDDSKYSKLTKRAKSTRNLDFNKMIDLDIIERFGQGKNTYYKLKS